MLSREEAEALGARLDQLKCTDPKKGDGLFTFALQKEPSADAVRYELHLRECEFCRVALEVYRYKRDVAEALGKESK